MVNGRGIITLVNKAEKSSNKYRDLQYGFKVKKQ